MTSIISGQIRDGTIQRVDLNIVTVGAQVIQRVLQDANGIITFTSTGVDSGTGDVTIKHLDTQGYKHIPTGGNVGEVLTNSASGTVVWSAYSSLSYWTKTGNDLSYSAGNVGIGVNVASPLERLHIVGNVRVEGTNSPLIAFFKSTTNTGYIGTGSDNNIFTGALPDSLAIRATNAMHLGTNGNNIRMTILSTGNVGIGTTAPTQTLTVQSLTHETLALLRDANNNDYTTGYYHRLKNSANNWFNYVWIGGGISSNVAGSENGIYYISTAKSGASASYSNPDFYIKNGNVGIGTTSPAYKLDVNGGISINAKSLIGASGYFISGSSGFRWNNSTDAYNNVIMYDNGNMYVRGNVGIGTTAPGFALDVVRTSGNATSRFYSNSAAGQVASLHYAGDGTTSSRYTYSVFRSVETSSQQWNAGMYGDKNYTIFDDTANLARLTINTSGNVGIGTTNSLQKLHVAAGDINLDSTYGIRVNNTATDGHFLRGNGTRFVPSFLAAGDIPLNDKGGWVYNSQLDLLYSSRQNIISHVSVGAAELVRDNTFQVFNATAQYAEAIISTSDGSFLEFNNLLISQNDLTTGFRGLIAHSFDWFDKSFPYPNAVVAGFHGTLRDSSLEYAYAEVFPNDKDILQGLRIRYISDGDVSYYRFASLFRETQQNAAFEITNYYPGVMPVLRLWHSDSGQYLQFTHNSSGSAIESNEEIHVIGVGGISMYTGGIITYVRNAGLGIDISSPAALLHIGAGISTKAPLKFTQGTNLTTPQAGAVEWDGTRMYVTNSVRNTLAYTSELPTISNNGANRVMLGSATANTITASSNLLFANRTLSIVNETSGYTESSVFEFITKVASTNFPTIGGVVRFNTRGDGTNDGLTTGQNLGYIDWFGRASDGNSYKTGHIEVLAMNTFTSKSRPTRMNIGVGGSSWHQLSLSVSGALANFTVGPWDGTNYQDMDFIVEGSQGNLLVADAGLQAIAIGGAIPKSGLDVQSSFGNGPSTQVAVDTTLGNSYCYMLVGASANRTFTLPDRASVAGRNFMVINSSVGYNLAIVRSGLDKANGGNPTITLAAGDVVIIHATSNADFGWFISANVKR